jgi:hypothetical protein
VFFDGNPHMTESGMALPYGHDWKMIITARCCSIPLALLLSACSSVNTTEPTYVRPSPPTEKAIGAAVAALAIDAKLVTPLEISALRPTDHGPGSFFVCVREVNPPPDRPRRYYSTFLDNDVYKDSRLSVIMDQCELQTYSPAPVAVPAKPPAAPVATPAKHKRHDQSLSEPR